MSDQELREHRRGAMAGDLAALWRWVAVARRLEDRGELAAAHARACQLVAQRVEEALPVVTALREALGVSPFLVGDWVCSTGFPDGPPWLVQGYSCRWPTAARARGKMTYCLAQQARTGYNRWQYASGLRLTVPPSSTQLMGRAPGEGAEEGPPRRGAGRSRKRP